MVGSTVQNAHGGMHSIQHELEILEVVLRQMVDARALYASAQTIARIRNVMHKRNIIGIWKAIRRSRNEHDAI